MASSLVVFLLAVGLWSRHRGVLAGHGGSKLLADAKIPRNS